MSSNKKSHKRAKSTSKSTRGYSTPFKDNRDIFNKDDVYLNQKTKRAPSVLNVIAYESKNRINVSKLLNNYKGIRNRPNKIFK
mmetsp:Transcript_22647/g.20128  ORF Transcript_22647/g.20128 Transcript_22647/m.20128 type:complete len:83 (-) Transcript_22647:224-472(-)